MIQILSAVRLSGKAWRFLRERGLITTLGLAVRKFISSVADVGVVYFFECDLRAGLPQVRPIPGIIAREAFLGDVDLLDGTENASARKADAIERFRKGDRWFVGIDAATGKLTNYRWVTTTWELIPELQLNILPKPGEAYIYALYTLPEYRKRGIDSFTRQYTYDLLYRTSGITRIIAYICAGNTANLRASRRFLKKIGRVWYVSVRGRRTQLFMRPNRKMPTLAPMGSPIPHASFPTPQFY